jgi:hypothetical protein
MRRGKVVATFAREFRRKALTRKMSGMATALAASRVSPTHRLLCPPSLLQENDCPRVSLTVEGTARENERAIKPQHALPCPGLQTGTPGPTRWRTNT